MSQLNLFGSDKNLVFPQNLLEYYAAFLHEEQGRSLMHQLAEEVPWTQQTIRMYGKQLLTPRLTAWYGDKGKAYRFSGSTFEPLPWTAELSNLKEKIAEFTGLNFNSVLLNYYRNGNDSVAWHSDNEEELGNNPCIVSVSLGQPRQFDFRHKTDHSGKYSLRLENGSLLIMKGDLQHHWEHRIPKSAKDTGERINLTFRTIM
ncbi:alpha-ketoglutarate-dependent dioxygenase AlkB family protein [Dyadobacter sediminis]|uniref:Alpha-ketoglutarate-dependent dioxygenase AlkB n=1 Tax=Dyadobacter sediminis TaxID=1493691 RepID=A0A5R9KJG5_9BACT|nr:alpha-ketoglutarate-dependent dioxygenase AlkB [Dyadobacter sediminis]TLU96332.1 alpha-ketoglutarate-dependent dioxygenase AlkB [Dyadobacter sediminis]GGB81362.1 alpha-ketoglutarate-dependent dioxygenase AlkB [Dyadobacter sediminis]